MQSPEVGGQRYRASSPERLPQLPQPQWQPAENISQTTLPWMPPPDAASSQALVNPSSSSVAPPEEKKYKKFLRAAVPVVAGAAAGVGVYFGLPALFPAIADWAVRGVTVGPAVVGAATAIAGYGVTSLTQKILSPGTKGPIVDQDGYDRAMSSSNAAATAKASLLFGGALLATGALGIGVDLGLKAIAPSYAATINTAIGPALWGFTNAVAGAVTFLLTQRIIEPFSAWVTTWSLKTSPIKASYSPETVKSLVDVNLAANGVNGLALNGGLSVQAMINRLQEPTSDVSKLLKSAAALSARGSDVAAARALEKVEEAAAIYAGSMINAEVFSFAVKPEFKAAMLTLNQGLTGWFERVPEPVRSAFIEATIARIRANRPPPTDPRTPEVEAAIKSYFRPILQVIVNGGLRP